MLFQAFSGTFFVLLVPWKLTILVDKNVYLNVR